MRRKSCTAAFFDVDNTLLNLKSMFAFQAYFYANASSHTGTFANMAEFVADLHSCNGSEDRSALNRRFYESFRGRRVDAVSQLAEQWFAAALAQFGDSLWIASARELAEQLRDEGFLLVAVSGSSHEILRPLLRHLEFDACLATTLASEAGVYTGHIIPPQLIGAGKAEAMRRFAQERG
ncbi:HAD family hydrolase, partial [Noviherbaspirillum denitrificans]|uniref:HAD family hydrolase n=1 Tax=Noviherbaspirillum denitrificans TaxID=1968433 RepID=UPI00197D9BD0